MRRPFLTILTTPILPAPTRLYRNVRTTLRLFVKPGVPLPELSPYPGHYAVVRSVVTGLRAIEADFNFNPVAFAELARVVYAPANEALRQAAALKRDGRIDFLVAGPVNALFPSECDGIIRLPEIDLLIIAAEWARDFYRNEAPALLPKLRVCQAGVDAEFWKPSGGSRSDRALIYWKSGNETFCEQVEAIVRTCGLEPVRVRSRHGEHGHFDAAGYRQILDEAVLGVFLSTFETQGLALAEAWSMDVPTVVWNPCGVAEWRGQSFQSGSSCPFLTAATGLTWRSLADLEPALREALQTRNAFRPRDWVLAHMTDAICSAALYRIIQEGISGR